MKNFAKLIALVLLSLTVLHTTAQQIDTLEIQRNDKGIVNFARFKPNSDGIIQNDTLFLKSILHAKKEDSFRTIGEFTFANGRSHKKMQQYYKGIKVENAEYLIHSNNGKVESLNGNFERVEISSVTPAINEQQALSKALDFVHANKYKWEDESLEKFIKQRTNNSNSSYYPKGELVIGKDYFKGSNNFILAWKFTISSLIPENEQWIYIDANTSEVVGNTPLILDSNTPGTAQTIYTQTVPITCDYYWDGTKYGYRLSETRNTTPNHSVNIHTWNCLSQPVYTNSHEFSNNTFTWTVGNWPAIGQDQAALDAHWGEERILDYWSTVRNRNSLNNQGLDILGYVHYFDSQSNAGWPNNAQWDPTGHVMRYGDGDNYNFRPLTALDVVAHEMGHGINQFTANLHSSTGDQECDALNEGFSDIWGATIENWASLNKQTWLMGEEVVILPGFNCIRDLQNPNSTTALEHPHPDTYHGSYWSSVGEPHYNSTVLSHWYYLLSQGGSGWNNGLTSNAPAHNGYFWSVSGIGITTAASIAYSTEAYYINSSANYSAVRTASIQATRDAFGIGSAQEIAVTNAWFAVGVGNGYQYPITGPTTLCYTNSNYAINNLPAGYTINWTQSSSIQRISADGSNPCLFSASGSDLNGWIQATLNSTYTTQRLSNIKVGTPNILSVSGPYNPRTNVSNIFYSANANLDNITAYIWSINPTGPYLSPTPGSNTCGITFYSDGYYMILVKAQNVCGLNNIPYGYQVHATSGGSLSVSPNPVSDELNVTVQETTTILGDTTTTSNSIYVAPIAGDKTISYNVTIADYMGNPIYSAKKYDKSFVISVQSFRDGNYILKVDDGTNQYSKQFVVKHN